MVRKPYIRKVTFLHSFFPEHNRSFVDIYLLKKPFCGKQIHYLPDPVWQEVLPHTLFVSFHGKEDKCQNPFFTVPNNFSLLLGKFNYIWKALGYSMGTLNK